MAARISLLKKWADVILLHGALQFPSHFMAYPPLKHVPTHPPHPTHTPSDLISPHSHHWNSSLFLLKHTRLVLTPGPWHQLLSNLQRLYSQEATWLVLSTPSNTIFSVGLSRPPTAATFTTSPSPYPWSLLYCSTYHICGSIFASKVLYRVLFFFFSVSSHKNLSSVRAAFFFFLFLSQWLNSS